MRSKIKKKIIEEIFDLYEEGVKVLNHFVVDNYPDIAKKQGYKKEKGFVLNARYQQWYSKALPAIKKLSPDRYEEFVGLYQTTKARKEITFENYAIYDYLRGLRVSLGGKTTVDSPSVFFTNFQQQLNILLSVSDRISSVLSDIEGTLQAELFDDELAAAEELLKNGHLRAAGVLAGVALEGHLANVCDIHSISFRKKNVTLSNYNDALKNADVIELRVWRRIQGLIDIRNLCAHNKKNHADPKKEDAEELISGTNRILKSVS